MAEELETIVIKARDLRVDMMKDIIDGGWTINDPTLLFFTRVPINQSPSVEAIEEDKEAGV